MGHGGKVLAGVGALTACLVAGSLLGAPVASAGRTPTFHIYNLTGAPLKLTDTSVDPSFADRDDAPIPPEEGDVLKPGLDQDDNSDHNRIEITYRTLYRNSAGLTYRPVGGGPGEIRVLLQDSECSDCIYRPTARCYMISSQYQCKTDGSTVFFLDPPGTVHQVTAENVQKQAEVLSNLCTKGNLDKKLATCKFKAKNRDLRAFGHPHLVGGVIPNCTEHEVINKVEEKDKQELTNSWGVKYTQEFEVGAIFETAKVGIEVEYGGEYTSAHEFTHKLDVPISPLHIGWIEGVNPVVRYTGDYTLTIGNTTWDLRGVYFDYPDPSRQGAVNWKPREEKMTPAQLKAECSGPPPAGKRLKSAPASYATIKQRGSGDTEALVGGRESTTLVARGGNDILRGASGNDRLRGGPGRDAIYAGPGSDTVVDSRGRTWVATGPGGRSGPDFVDVRDGEGNDRVLCGNRKAMVKADAGDRLRHCGR
jgi:hypothetical protein